jgi:hypothetical protein
VWLAYRDNLCRLLLEVAAFWGVWVVVQRASPAPLCLPAPACVREFAPRACEPIEEETHNDDDALDDEELEALAADIYHDIDRDLKHLEGGAMAAADAMSVRLNCSTSLALNLLLEEKAALEAACAGLRADCDDEAAWHARKLALLQDSHAATEQVGKVYGAAAGAPDATLARMQDKLAFLRAHARGVEGEVAIAVSRLRELLALHLGLPCDALHAPRQARRANRGSGVPALNDLCWLVKAAKTNVWTMASVDYVDRAEAQVFREAHAFLGDGAVYSSAWNARNPAELVYCLNLGVAPGCVALALSGHRQRLQDR